ncbi:uncharacterized protein Bfra_001942 [Botrytis fragariae]|uniref:Uncharacterized protein n=1 Tax=Botrytis fragariae TaxID=1964551 RepID=A0A8H6EMR3_9HELO|nr:uncharacterized protein Bfra_001942 [Botrytis fragariae]KAF5877575.1 hypothetical protein Bfra_001942 [Botrytis fragariae]
MAWLKYEDVPIIRGLPASTGIKNAVNMVTMRISIAPTLHSRKTEFVFTSLELYPTTPDTHHVKSRSHTATSPLHCLMIIVQHTTSSCRQL